MDFNAKEVFMIDGVGAILSAISLGVLLPIFEEYTGIPTPILYCFALIAVVFAIYSWTCYLIVKINHKFFLRTIAVANTLYIIATLIVLYKLYEQLSIIGLMYFIVELLIITVIIFLELKTSNKR